MNFEGTQVWSCGGGTQSAAIAALIVNGTLPAPDVALIADTGREASETWRFYDDVLVPQLLKVGVDLIRIPHTFEGKGYNTVDLLSGKDKTTIVMPMFTNKDGIGMLPKYCSNEWKSRPVDRVLREMGYKRGSIWIGFSIDEMRRARKLDTTKKWNHVYPLADLKMTRADCIALVESMGWGTPPRSACWMCPYHTNDEWRHLKNNEPEDFAKAVALEVELQKIDKNVYFHNNCEPLDTVDFGDVQTDLFGKPCESGMCFT